MKGFWKDGLSIKETKFSILGFMLIVSFIYSLVYHFTHGDLSTNLLDLIKSQLFAFVGVNAVDRVSAVMDRQTNESGE